MVNVFYAKEATVKIDAAGTSTFATNTVLDTEASSATAITAQFKDLSINMPVGDVEKIDLLGTTSSYQNAEMDEKPAGLYEVSGTLILEGDELLNAEVWGSPTAAGGTHSTYSTGLASRSQVELMINLDDGTDEVNFAFDYAYITQFDVSLASDGHVEVSVTFKGLPKYAYGPQFKD